MSVFGKTKRKIFARKLRSFWQDFSHNKIGFVGLSIVLLYVGVAFLAPYMTPYTEAQALRPPRVAHRYAMPQWFTLFPGNEDLPPTFAIPFSWTSIEEYESIQMLYDATKVTVLYNNTEGTTTAQEYFFKIHFDYPYRSPPAFTVRYDRTATWNNLRYRIEVYLICPDGHEYPLAGRDYDQVIKRVVIPPAAWNRASYSETPTSGSITLRQRLFYEELYEAIYVEEFENYRTTLYKGYYNTTSRSRYNWYVQTYGTDQSFTTYWDEYWNTTGLDAWNTFWLGHISTAERYTDAQAKNKADTAARNLAPETIIFSQKGKYTLLMRLIVEPSSANASLTVNFSPENSFRVWGAIHGLLGTNSFGGDVFTQLVYGARISLIVGILAAVLSTSLGILTGVSSGYLGGVVDEFTMRVVDVLLCLPVLPILLALSSYFKPNVYWLVVIIAIFGWQGLSRVIRSRVLSLREMPFVESAKAAGGSDSYLIRRHLIPNVFPIAMASMVLAVPAAILTEAALSFLGFGDPNAATWGKMLFEAQTEGAFKALAFHYVIPPGLAITFLCVAFVFLGHALDEIVNPRLRRRR